MVNKRTLTQYKSDNDPAQKRYWPSTKVILTRYKSGTDPVQKQYHLIPFLVPLHKVSVPAVPEPVTSPLLVYGTGTCTGAVWKTCIKRYRIGALYRIQWYRTGTAYHCWTVPERVPIDTRMFTGNCRLLAKKESNQQTHWNTHRMFQKIVKSI